MADLEPIFLGFLAKKVIPRPDWLKCPVVEEVCSVSECMSPGAPDRIERWTHNAAGFYDTEELALDVVPADQKGSYTPFVYRMYPLRFDEEQPDEDWDPRAEWPELLEAPDLADYELLGFDLVGRSLSDLFECSPLSCNGVASEIEVNRWCLIDDLDRAIEVGRKFGQLDSGVEPAAYYLVEVWRKRT